VTDLADLLNQGKIVALPTDTVPGLAIRADADGAADALARVKGYAEPRPFSLHFHNLKGLGAIAPSLPPGLASWLQHFLPQGVTAVLPADWLAIPSSWRWSWPKVGLRVPQHPEYQEVTAQVKAPLLMTSINSMGSEPLFGDELMAWLQGNGIEGHACLAETTASESSAVVEFDPLPQLRRGQMEPEDLLLGLRILILCSGNICRSPVAEVMLRAEVASAWGIAEVDLERLGWKFASAGTFAMPDGPASEHSVRVAADVGLDLSSHRSANMEDLLDQSWDLLLGMGLNHLAPVPDSLVKDLYDPLGRPVPDPFGGPLPAYQELRDHLQMATAERVRQWSEWRD